jgi:hypothetical protein
VYSYTNQRLGYRHLSLGQEQNWTRPLEKIASKAPKLELVKLERPLEHWDQDSLRLGDGFSTRFAKKLRTLIF